MVVRVVWEEGRGGGGPFETRSQQRYQAPACSVVVAPVLLLLLGEVAVQLLTLFPLSCRCWMRAATCQTVAVTSTL